MSNTPLNSCLYECRVMHQRLAPRRHRFSYRIFMMAVDLDELPALGAAASLLGVNRTNLYSFRDADYFPSAEPRHNATGVQDGSGGGLKDRVLAFLRSRGLDAHRVVLVTLPRIAGYLFNPVSFYYCYDRAGAAVAAVVEVTNTFREMKHYLLGPETREGEAGAFRMRQPKFFYVSPFSDVDVAFDFRLAAPGEGLAVRIDDYEGERRTLTSTVTGARRPLTGARLAWFSLKYPLLTLRVIALIHLHALALYLKKVPWFAKAARARDQRDLYRPHSSIAKASLH